MPSRHEREFRSKRDGRPDPWCAMQGPTHAQIVARQEWGKLLAEGDPAKESEARRLARQAVVSEVEIDHLHRLHFHKLAAQAAPAQPPAVDPVPPAEAQPVDRSDVPTTAANMLDERMEKARDCRGSFKGK